MHASNHVHRSVGVLVQITSITLIDYNRKNFMVNMHFTYITRVVVVKVVVVVVVFSKDFLTENFLKARPRFAEGSI